MGPPIAHVPKETIRVSRFPLMVLYGVFGRLHEAHAGFGGGKFGPFGCLLLLLAHIAQCLKYCCVWLWSNARIGRSNEPGLSDASERTWLQAVAHVGTRGRRRVVS